MRLVTDTFTAANGALPSPWVTITSEVGPIIHSNHIETDNAGFEGGARYNDVNYAPNDCIIGIQILTLPATQGGSIGVQGRIATGAQTAYVCIGTVVQLNSGTDATFDLYYLNAGVYTLLSETTGFAISANDILTLKLRGSELTGYLNGVLRVGPITDTNLTTGQAGVYITDYTTPNLSQADNWTLDDLVIPSHQIIYPLLLAQ